MTPDTEEAINRIHSAREELEEVTETLKVDAFALGEVYDAIDRLRNAEALLRWDDD